MRKAEILQAARIAYKIIVYVSVGNGKVATFTISLEELELTLDHVPDDDDWNVKYPYDIFGNGIRLLHIGEV